MVLKKNRQIFYFSSILLFVFACNSKNKIQNIENNNKKSKLNVSIIKLKQINFSEQLILNGKIDLKQKTDLMFKTSDRLVYVNVKNSQRVFKGKLLASLENSLLKNNIEKAKIEQQKAQSKLIEEKINFGKKNRTIQVLENLELKSGLLETKNNLERAQIEYNHTLLKAPFSGVIANFKKKEGDFIRSSEVFCTIINPNDLDVLFSILENEFDFINIGQTIKIQSFVNKNKKFIGVISEINPIVDKNGLIRVKARITSKNTGFLDGMNVKVVINKYLKDVLVIPKEALVLRSNKKVVFSVEKGLAKWNYVEVAGENNNNYAIKKGLKITDTIIVSGNLNLSHDVKVNTTFIVDDTTKK